MVAGVEPARLAPDPLAVAGEVGELGGPDACALEPSSRAEVGQLAHRVRQQVDADAERLELRHALEDLAGNADRCRLSASVSPPMPPPAISTVMIPSWVAGAS